MTTVSLLSWMLQSTLLLGACWLFYRLLLRAEPAFQFNRGLLLLAPLLALALPLLPLPAGWLSAAGGAAGGLLPAFRLPEVSVRPGNSPLLSTSLPWAVLLYGAGVLLSLLGQARHLLRLWRRTRHLPRQPAAGYVLRPTGGQLPTSSFGRQVFWDDTAPLSPPEAAQVLAHELTHVRQGHSADRLWLGFWQALLWFNPFVYLHARALVLTHEFLADAAALPGSKTGAAPRAYGALLARQALAHLVPAPALTHSFSNSQTLTRIAMLNHQMPARRWKQWLALPLLGLLLGVAACEKATDLGGPPPPPPPAVVAPPPPPPPPMMVLDQADEMPEYAGGMERLMQDLGTCVKYPEAAAQARVEGKVLVEFVVGIDGLLQNPGVKKTITTPHTPALERALEAAALQAVTSLPGRWTPGRQDGKPVPVRYILPITFAL